MRRPAEGAVLAGAVALSILGAALHAVREFGPASLAAPSSGFLPVAGAQAALLLAWSLLPERRRGLAAALAATGWLQLVGGAVVSVLPLPLLPFLPEQSAGHYASHALLGVCQLPLVAFPWWPGRR